MWVCEWLWQVLQACWAASCPAGLDVCVIHQQVWRVLVRVALGCGHPLQHCRRWCAGCQGASLGLVSSDSDQLLPSAGQEVVAACGATGCLWPLAWTRV
jgi:hypothetical protein